MALARSMTARTMAESTELLRDALDEGPVHFYLVHRELLEVSKRRVAGAEVIDGQPDPEPVELLHHLAGTGQVLHHHRLGDLEDE